MEYGRNGIYFMEKMYIFLSKIILLFCLYRRLLYNVFYLEGMIKYRMYFMYRYVFFSMKDLRKYFKCDIYFFKMTCSVIKFLLNIILDYKFVLVN